MNQLKLDNTGGFPMDTNVLAFMQSAYGLFNALGNLAGNLSIIQGCEVTGTSVSDGVVYINGEVLPFRGGTASPNVVIKEEVKSLPFEDGQPKPVEKIRYATFGGGTPFYQWVDFKRLDNLQELKEQVEELYEAKEDKTKIEELTKQLTTQLVSLQKSITSLQEENRLLRNEIETLDSVVVKSVNDTTPDGSGNLILSDTSVGEIWVANLNNGKDRYLKIKNGVIESIIDRY